MTNTISAVAQRRGSLAANRTTTRLGGPAVAANMAINQYAKVSKENFGSAALPTASIAEGADQTRKRNRKAVRVGMRFQYQTIGLITANCRRKRTAVEL